MTPAMVVELLRQALLTTLWVSLPLLAIGFVAGILTSLVQILTSIQDPGFGTIPRLAAFLAGTLLFLPWMLLKLIGYAAGLLGSLEHYAR